MFTFLILDCGGLGVIFGASVVSSTAHETGRYPASSVLTVEGQWLGRGWKTTGQFVVIKLDTCPRWISGCQIMNTNGRASREFRVSGNTNLAKTLACTEKFQISFIRFPKRKRPLANHVGGWTAKPGGKYPPHSQLHLRPGDRSTVPEVWHGQHLGRGGGWSPILCCNSCNKWVQDNNHFKMLLIITTQLTATSLHGQNGLPAAMARDRGQEMQSAVTTVRQWVKAKNALKTIAQVLWVKYTSNMNQNWLPD